MEPLLEVSFGLLNLLIISSSLYLWNSGILNKKLVVFHQDYLQSEIT